jgi:hypothetical protein
VTLSRSASRIGSGSPIPAREPEPGRTLTPDSRPLPAASMPSGMGAPERELRASQGLHLAVGADLGDGPLQRSGRLPHAVPDRFSPSARSPKHSPSFAGVSKRTARRHDIRLPLGSEGLSSAFEVFAQRRTPRDVVAPELRGTDRPNGEHLYRRRARVVDGKAGAGSIESARQTEELPECRRPLIAPASALARQ